MTQALDGLVRNRAKNLCEYCLLSQAAHAWRFEIDHIIAQQHGGLTEIENLALCCPKCNRHKGPNVAGVDPQTKQIARLFHPRRDHWDEHFQWLGPQIVGLTEIGRATVVALNLNDAVRIAVRTALMQEGNFTSSRGIRPRP